MKRVFFILNFIFIIFGLNAKSYRPYPIIFAHGVGVTSKTWGVKAYERSDTIIQDSLLSGRTFDHFLNLMQPYILADPFFIQPEQEGYPNRDLLEIINFDVPRGSIDRYSKYKGPYEGQGDELWHRIKEVLDEYYGEGQWESDPNAKVILIGHSMGALASRQAIKEDVIYHDSLLTRHIDKVITLGAPLLGSVWETPWLRYGHTKLLYEWHPVILPFSWAITSGVKWIISKIPSEPPYDNVFSAIEEHCAGWPAPVRCILGQAMQASASEAIIRLARDKPSNDGDKDMSFGSSFITGCDSYGAGSGIKFHSLRYHGFFESKSSVTYPGNSHLFVFPFGTGSEMKSSWTLGCVAEAGYAGAAFFNPWLWKWVAKGGASLIYWQFWNNESDFACNLRSQDINKAGSGYNAEVQTHWGIIHGEEGRRWEDIRNAIAEPPVFYWDKIVDVDGEEIEITDESQDKISVDLGEQRPDSLIGSIDDYFLAESDVYVSFNFGDWQKLNWMEDFGYNENHFILRGLDDEKVIFPGWNQIQVKAKNLVGEWGKKRTLRIKWDPFKTYIDFLSLNDEDCFKSPLDTTIKVRFESNLSVIEAETLHVTFNNGPFKDTVVVLGEVYEDTLNCPIHIEEGEGVYLMEAICVNAPGNKVTKNIERFFIDNTPPEPLITLPKEIDSIVHSSRVEEQMPIVFKLTDNFDSLINKPLNGKISMEIMDSDDNLVWEDTIGACFYQLPKGIYWDFRDLDNIKVTNSGKYSIVISCLDKAGNFGSDTSFFFIDNEPPIISVLSPFDSILTSNEDFVKLDYQINENAEIKLKWTDTDEKWVTREGYASAEPDTNYFFEGADIFGDYLADGLYTAQFTAEDNVGNDTIYTEGIVQGNTLRVDRTAPAIGNFNIHLLANINDTLDVTFTISEKDDKLINRGKVKVKIYIDTNLVNSSEKSPGGSEVIIKEKYNISALKNGVHKVIVSAEDKWGNINTRLTEIVKGTIGTKITHPEEGDTLGQGWIMIKGLANDPDITKNTIPFGGFGLYYKQSSASTWDSTNIIVPENLREPGIPRNKGNKPVPNESVLGRWDVGSLSGFYDLRLRSWEVEGAELSDTHTLYIDEQEEITSPEITWNVEIEGDGDGVFEPDTGEIIIVDYQLSVKPADISFDVLNQSGRNVAHLEEKGIMPVSSSEPSIEREGLHLCFYDNKWWIKCKFNGFGMVSGEILSLEDKNLTITETSDTLMTPLSLQEGKIEFSYTNISDPYEGGFAFTGKGRIQFNLSFNKSKEIWLGESKLESPFALGLADTIFYNGTEFGAGQIPGGTYTIRLSAEGMDGMGYHELTDEILVETDLKIENELTSDIAYPLEDLPATVSYKINQKAAVKIDVYKGSDFLLNIEDIDSVAGGIWLSASWNGIKSDSLSYDTGSNYRFRITAYMLPDRTDSCAVISDDFSVMDLVSSGLGSFFIHPDYYVGEIHDDSVFNGKTDFLWKASATGKVYPPQEYTFVDTAKGWKKREINWKIRFRRTVMWFERRRSVIGEAKAKTYISSSRSMSVIIPYDQTVNYSLDAYAHCTSCDCWDIKAGVYPHITVDGWLVGIKDSVGDGGTLDTNITGSKFLHKGEEVRLYEYIWGYGHECTWPFRDGTAEARDIARILYNIGDNTLIEKDSVSGIDTILANVSSPGDLLYTYQCNPFDPVITPDSNNFVYTLETTIDGITKKDSTTDPAGRLSTNTNGVTVSINNISENQLHAYMYDTLCSNSLWLAVKEKSGVCNPIGPDEYRPDTTFLMRGTSTLFEIPPEVHPPTVRYSDPFLIEGDDICCVDKVGTGAEDTCIVVTVDNWTGNWSTAMDSHLDSSIVSSKPLPFILGEDFDRNGIRDQIIRFGEYYCDSSKFQRKMKVNIEGNLDKIGLNTEEIDASGWLAPSNLYTDLVIRFTSPYNGDQSGFIGEKGYNYEQYICHLSDHDAWKLKTSYGGISLGGEIKPRSVEIKYDSIGFYLWDEWNSGDWHDGEEKGVKKIGDMADTAYRIVVEVADMQSNGCMDGYTVFDDFIMRDPFPNPYRYYPVQKDSCGINVGIDFKFWQSDTLDIFVKSVSCPSTYIRILVKVYEFTGFEKTTYISYSETFEIPPYKVKDIRFVNPYYPEHSNIQTGNLEGETGDEFGFSMTGNNQENVPNKWSIVKNGSEVTTELANCVVEMEPLPVNYYAIEETIEKFYSWGDSAIILEPGEYSSNFTMSSPGIQFGYIYEPHWMFEWTLEDTIMKDSTSGTSVQSYKKYKGINVSSNINFSPGAGGTGSVSVETGKDYFSTFWYRGDSANQYLKINDWRVDLLYPNGDTNKDLFANSPPVTPPDELVTTHGYNEGHLDYFQPLHFMMPENAPRSYVEIDGHSDSNIYKMYEFDGKHKREITDTLMPPVDSSSPDTTPLAYWNVTDVCGKRRLIMERYNPGENKDPFELRYRDFYIGNPYRPDSGDIAHSPFYRAKLFFDSDQPSFDSDTLTSISPVPIDYMTGDLSYHTPLLGGYRGPIVLLQPKGAKFEKGKPTIEYYYTETEASPEAYNLYPGNVSLFAVSNNGFLRDITSRAFWDDSTSDKILTLKAAPDSFPGGGDYSFFVSLKDSQTVSYNLEVNSLSYTNIDSAKINIITDVPNQKLLLIRSGKEEYLQSSNYKMAATSSVSSLSRKNNINIYTAIEAFKNQSGGGGHSKSLVLGSSSLAASETDTVYIDVGSDGMWEGYVHLESGNNYIFVGHREAMLYALAPDSSMEIRNCPIGFTKITLDITGPEIVFTRDPDPLISYIGDMESIAFYPTENAYIHYIKSSPSGEIIDAMSFYSLAYDTTIIYWDGTDEYGRLYEEGVYPYILFAIDDFGNSSREEKHQWEIRWGIPVKIVSPPSGVWLKGSQTLRSRIEGDYTYPVDWYKKWNETWGYIGTEDPSGDGIEWNTTLIPDEKNFWIKASVEDVFGHIGADSVRIAGIDNHAPEIYTWVGVPKYLDEFISAVTPIFASAEDTMSGIDFFNYSINEARPEPVLDTFNLLGFSDGRYQIGFRAKDFAGNEAQVSLSLYLDDTPPLSHLIFGEPKKMHNDTLYISPSTPIWIEALDTCGVAHSFYSVSPIPGAGSPEWTEATDSFNIPYTPPYYRYIISYYSEDNLGNVELPKDTVVAVDCDPPVTILNIGDPRYPLPSDSSIIYITSETPLSFEATDDISGVDSIYYQVDGAGWIANRYPPSAGRIEFNIEDEGTHTVEYYSVDKAGNREDINSKELRVDETHPVSQLVTGDPHAILDDCYPEGARGRCGDGHDGGDSSECILISSSTPLVLSAEDPLSNGVASGVKELEYEVTPLTADRQPLSAIVEGDSTEFTITGEDGSYKVDYRARDNVLNEEPFNSKYYELDNTPPVAMIISPLDSTMVSHTITIIGTVNDKHFKEYVLEYGKGIDPGDWTTIIVSDKEVEDSVLGKLNVSCIPGDIITVRLRATDLVGNEAIDEVILWKGDLICDFDIPLHKPEGVDYDDQGNIYATDREGGKKLRCRDMVKKFDPFGNLIYEISDRYVPNDVAVTPWNNILISEQVRKEITEFNQSQEYLRSIKYLKGPDGVDVTRLPDSGMRCEEKGELKGFVIGVADQTANKVILYDSLFRKIKEINITDKKLRCYHHPEGISFDKEGNVYTCLINNDVVRKYNLDGNILMEITGFNKPSDIEVDYRGYIWVTDRNNDRIRCFDAYGNHLFKYGKKGKECGEFNKPEGIAVNHERLYVADMNNDRVQVLRFPFSVLYPNLSSIGKSRQEALSIQECVPYPNPCNPAREFSNIRVVVNNDCEIEVRIYSLTGTLLWETSITGFAGINEVTWNGMNQDGEEVRNGVYNVLVRAKDGSQRDEERTKIIVYRR